MISGAQAGPAHVLLDLTATLDSNFVSVCVVADDVGVRCEAAHPCASEAVTKAARQDISLVMGSPLLMARRERPAEP